MPFGKDCTRCGNCCKAIPCRLGLAFLNDVRPCPALKEDSQGKYTCLLLTEANQFFDVGEQAGWKNAFLSRLFSHMLGIGYGCCSSPEGEAIADKMRESLARKGLRVIAP